MNIYAYLIQEKYRNRNRWLYSWAILLKVKVFIRRNYQTHLTQRKMSHLGVGFPAMKNGLVRIFLDYLCQVTVSRSNMNAESCKAFLILKRTWKSCYDEIMFDFCFERFVFVSRKTRLIILGNGHPVIQSYVLRTFLNLSSRHTSYIKVSIGPHLRTSPFIYSSYWEKNCLKQWGEWSTWLSNSL